MMKHLCFWILIGLLIIVDVGVFLNRSNFPDNWSPLERLIPALALFLATVLLVIMWGIPKLYVRSLEGRCFDQTKQRLELEDESRKTLAQIVGGFLLLIGLIFTYSSYKVSTGQLEQTAQQSNTSLKQLKIIEEGQKTERFTKAVSLIGSTDLEARLAGLYALEQISKSSEGDYWPIMEIIAAYVRERSKRPPANPESVDTDIQAALNIVGRRTGKDEGVIDLTKANLDGAVLRGLNLSGAILTDIKLNRATLIDTDLSGAQLIEAELIDASISDGNLRRANLTGTRLEKTVFIGAKFDVEDNLTFEQLEKAIINDETELPVRLQNRKTELLVISRRNPSKR